jgi:hypothetical protein
LIPSPCATTAATAPTVKDLIERYLNEHVPRRLVPDMAAAAI